MDPYLIFSVSAIIIQAVANTSCNAAAQSTNRTENPSKSALSNYLIQQISYYGTSYFKIDDFYFQRPIYRFGANQRDHEFILFPDSEHPEGSGHYIVLWKLPSVQPTVFDRRSALEASVYQQHTLAFRDTIDYDLTSWAPSASGAAPAASSS